MGRYLTDKCFITEEKTNNIDNSFDGYDYTILVNDKRHRLKFAFDEEKITAAPWFIDHKHILRSLIWNNKWIKDEDTLLTIPVFKSIVEESVYPITPGQKMNTLFKKLYDLQNEDGQEVMVYSEETDKAFVNELFFKSNRELQFYYKAIEEKGWIIGSYHSSSGELMTYYVTISGMQAIIDMETEGEESNLCFVAMRFNDDTLPARKAIKSALRKTGYEPIIIDEVIIDSYRTINDEIIASIRRCKFCIADFSYHSEGVYFESGFALGLGKKVIYTCSKEEFDKRHFDIKPLQHIRYLDTNQLEKDLINRIEAWIK